jgi:PhnB protein
MAKLNPYLNFDGKAEEAFNFYKSVFGGEFLGEIHKMGNAPGTENLSDEEKTE